MYIYICNRYYKPSLHVSTDCLHANTQDDHANYNLLRTNNFSLIFCHHAAHIGKKNKTHKKKILTRGSWGLSPPAPPSYSLSLKRGNIFLPKSNSRNKAKWVQCWLLLSEEFQREWMDQLTLVHHITTLGDSTAFSSANRHNKPSHAGLRSRRSSSAVQGTRVRICAQTCTSRCRWTS